MTAQDVDFRPIDAGMHGPVTTPAPARGLGVGGIVFMVLAGAAPLGAVVAGWPVVIGVSGSTASPLFFLVATLILWLFSVGFTRMIPHVRNAGAFYSYIQAGLGRIVGIGAATFALGTYLLLFLALVSYVGFSAASTIESFTGISMPWWLWGAAIVLLTGFFAYRDVELSAKVLGLVLVVEVLAVVIVAVAAVAQGGAEGVNLGGFSPDRFFEGVPALGVMFAFFSFIGFEATAVFRNEARDPERTIPKATFIAVLGIGIFYGVITWALQVGIGDANIVEMMSTDPTNAVFGLASTYVSPVLAAILQVLIVTSLFACLLTFQNVLTRYLFTLGSRGLLPRKLGVINPKHRAPSFAALVVTVIALVMLVIEVLLGIDPVLETYTWLSGAATLGVIVLMALTSVAVIVYFRRNGTAGSNWRVVVAPALACLALTTIAVLVVSNFSLLVGSDGAAAVLLAILAAMFVAGAVMAVIMRRRRAVDFADLAAGDD